MAMNVRLCRDGDEWEALAKRCPYATVFHGWKFLSAVARHTKTEFFPLAGFDGTNPIGLYPLYRKKVPFCSAVFSPPQRAGIPYLGPLILDYDKLKLSKRQGVFLEFQKEADRYISKVLKAGYTFIITAPGLDDARPLRWSGYSIAPFYNYRLELSCGPEALRSGLRKKLRSAISQGLGPGESIREGGREELCALCDLLSDRYSEQGRTFDLSKEYLLEVYDCLPKEAKRLYVVDKGGKAECGMLDLCRGGVVSGWVGNPKPKDARNNLTDVLQWHSIESACRGGAQVYEEIGANTERLCRYKSKYGFFPSMHYGAKKYTPLGWLAENAYKGFVKKVVPGWN